MRLPWMLAFWRTYFWFRRLPHRSPCFLAQGWKADYPCATCTIILQVCCNGFWFDYVPVYILIRNAAGWLHRGKNSCGECTRKVGLFIVFFMCESPKSPHMGDCRTRVKTNWTLAFILVLFCHINHSILTHKPALKFQQGSHEAQSNLPGQRGRWYMLSTKRWPFSTSWTPGPSRNPKWTHVQMQVQ